MLRLCHRERELLVQLVASRLEVLQARPSCLANSLLAARANHIALQRYTMWDSTALQGLAPRPRKPLNLNPNPLLSFRPSRTASKDHCYPCCGTSWRLLGVWKCLERENTPRSRVAALQPRREHCAPRPGTPTRKLCCTRVHESRRYANATQLQSCAQSRAPRDRPWPRHGFIAIH